MKKMIWSGGGFLLGILFWVLNHHFKNDASPSALLVGFFLSSFITDFLDWKFPVAADLQKLVDEALILLHKQERTIAERTSQIERLLACLPK